MKLPNPDQAQVSAKKLREYLLATDHPIGRFKARFFKRLGFTVDNWEDLRDRLQQVAQGEAELVPTTQYGQKYAVFGTLVGPAGEAEVLTVWIVLAGDDIPQLVTVYPR